LKRSHSGGKRPTSAAAKASGMPNTKNLIEKLDQRKKSEGAWHLGKEGSILKRSTPKEKRDCAALDLKERKELRKRKYGKMEGIKEKRNDSRRRIRRRGTVHKAANGGGHRSQGGLVIL